jgi:phage antirepressor YoqD-like protein
MKKSTIPYQKYIDASYFEVSQEILESGQLVPFALVTGKGQLWLHQKLTEKEYITRRAVAGITQGVLAFSGL